jgi:N-acetylglucosamine-6-phosphate deacetylase
VLNQGLLTPGLVDLQLNGYGGIDLVSATPTQWISVTSALPKTGVTSFQPTFITAPIDALTAGVRRAAVAQEAQAGRDTLEGARILGVHLEGPFLSPSRAGVHDPGHMVAPAAELVEVLLTEAAADGPLTMVTLAPELPGALAAVRRLREAGIVVSIGHSNATAAQVRAAVDAGASMVTHVFNAQRGLGHREPGIPGQALAEPRLAIGLIADLQHVAAAVCQVVLQAARGRVALVTDAVAAAGMPPGRYELGGQFVEVLPGTRLPRRTDGTIAGSVLTLDQAVRNLVGLGCSPAEVLNAATRVPADVLDRRDLGRLTVGARADLVWWSDDLRPLGVWVGGRHVFPAGREPGPIDRSRHRLTKSR